MLTTTLPVFPGFSSNLQRLLIPTCPLIMLKLTRHTMWSSGKSTYIHLFCKGVDNYHSTSLATMSILQMINIHTNSTITYLFNTRASLRLPSDQAAFALTTILVSSIATMTVLAVSATNETSYKTNQTKSEKTFSPAADR